MSVKFPDSVEKVVFTYFAAITKVPFTVNGITVNPKPLLVSDSLALEHVCPSVCGACCLKLSLDYIDGEDHPESAHERSFELNGTQIRLWSDLQQDHKGERCKYQSLTDGLCGVHQVRAFSCDFELIRFYMGAIQNYNRIGMGHFGRTWNLTQVNGTKNVLCKFNQPTENSVKDTIRKLRRLHTWTEYFGLTETYTPEIIEFLENGAWVNGPITLFPNEEVQATEKLYKRPDRYPGRELIEELVAAGSYTRKQIMDTLLDSYPDVPRSAFSTHMTDAKNPTYTPYKGRKIVIDENGIWKFKPCPLRLSERIFSKFHKTLELET